MGEPIKRTSRGFGIYAEIIDTYGASVDVVESSSAERDCVWIYINGGHANAGQDMAAHLDLEQAKTIRDALSSWIENVED